MSAGRLCTEKDFFFNSKKKVEFPHRQFLKFITTFAELTEKKIRRERSNTQSGTKSGHFVTSLIHFPTSSGVSERANERTSERANELSNKRSRTREQSE